MPVDAAGDLDGAVNAAGNVLGTYVHGLFHNTELRRAMLNELARRKGVSLPEAAPELDLDREYDRLADSGALQPGHGAGVPLGGAEPRLRAHLGQLVEGPAVRWPPAFAWRWAASAPGKSAFAERLAGETADSVLYVATGVATDPEMQERIRRHREARPAHWTTLEAPLDLAPALAARLVGGAPPDAALIDSVDVWLANLLLAHEQESKPRLEDKRCDASTPWLR